MRVADTHVTFKFANGLLAVTLKQGDLSTETCDAIVNTTNLSMNPNGGLDSFIHSKMGEFFSSQVAAASEGMGDNACPLGQSRIFLSKRNRDPNTARYVINTVGPMYKPEESEQAAFHLQACYSSSLGLANQYSLTSIAYPAISCGVYRFPPNEAAKIAIESVRNYAYGVKDVRFVLFDNALFKIFLGEWMSYAEKVNQTTAVAPSGDRFQGRSKRPLPTTSSSSKLTVRNCTLCEEQPLPTGGKDLCVMCSNLSRPEIFDRILLILFNAGENSYNDLANSCKTLKSILTYYPLNYTPIKKYDHSSHQRDTVAEYYLQNQCDKKFRNGMPIAIVGDGNCFYNTFVKLGGAGSTTETSTITPVELRVRNIIELVLHRDDYTSKYSDLEAIRDNFESYVAREMVRDTNYAAIWDIFSLPTVLNINIITIYPYINSKEEIYYRAINDKTFRPLSSQGMASSGASNDRDVKLLFSHCNKPVQLGSNKKDWIPNHFVPILSLR